MTLIKQLDIQLGDVTDHNVQQLKMLNVTTLPVRYTDKFYHDLITNSPPELIKLAFWNGFSVGAVCSRIESHPVGGYNRLYIMTIAIFAPYRRRGIASKLLSHVLEQASKDPKNVEVYLHVQTSNEEARQFYLARGFEQTGMIQNYYKRIDPPDCYVLRKSLRSDMPLLDSENPSAAGQSS
eukprot:gene715-1376_t